MNPLNPSTHPRGSLRVSPLRESVRGLKILYEDDRYIVFDKPAGLLVIPSPKKEKNTLIDLVNRPEVPQKNAGRWHPCHRLDRDTSGVILFAKGKNNQQTMMDAFKRHKIQKRYIAFVQGRLKDREGEIKSLVKDFDQRRFHRHSPAKLSITRYKVREAKQHFSVLEVSPLTGRTNQIRIQFSQIGHPLLGERKYAFGKDFALKFRRTALHARSLQWFDPVCKKEIKVEAPLAQDMKQLWQNNS